MWYFHAVERPDGWWSCQHGRTAFDAHPTLAPAVEHLRQTAKEMGSEGEFFLHYLNGEVESA